MLVVLMSVVGTGTPELTVNLPEEKMLPKELDGWAESHADPFHIHDLLL
jgi:hypothetical protein